MSRRRQGIAWAAFVGVVFLVAPARADTAVLVPLRDAETGDSALTAARAALAEALKMQGVALLDFEVARQRVAAAVGCVSAGCLERLLEAEVVDVAAAVSLGRDQDGTPVRVFVTLTDRARELYEAEATMDAQDVRAATTRALLEARSLQLIGPGPWLRVDGAPDGAEVFVDDELRGTLPYRGRIAPGKHRLRVQAAGYTAFERGFEVSPAGPRKVDVEVDLQPGTIVIDASGASDDAAAGGFQTWMLGPISLGAAGVALATVTTVRLASGLESCVSEDDAGRCTSSKRISVVPTAVYYSVSAALIGGAVAWLVLGLEDGDSELTARVGVTSAVIEGRF